jgi:hypothetical protein
MCKRTRAHTHLRFRVRPHKAHTNVRHDQVWPLLYPRRRLHSKRMGSLDFESGLLGLPSPMLLAILQPAASLLPLTALLPVQMLGSVWEHTW